MQLDKLGTTPAPVKVSLAEEAWSKIEKSLQDEDTELDAEHDLERMRENEEAHLTASVAQYVVLQPESPEAIQRVLPHLCRCSWCRTTLYETLSLCGKEADHAGYALLKTAEEWARWESAGRGATQEARNFLRTQEANIIYDRDGVVWEERPDGTAYPVSEGTRMEKSCS